MSACDTCRDPGACCRNIRLWGGERGPIRQRLSNGEFLVPEGSDPVRFLGGLAGKYSGQEPLPFLPKVKRDTFEPRPLPDWDGPLIGETLSTYSWSCPRLLPNGRCGDYENRPWLCRVYEPKADTTCVEYDPAVAEALRKAA